MLRAVAGGGKTAALEANAESQNQQAGWYGCEGNKPVFFCANCDASDGNTSWCDSLESATNCCDDENGPVLDCYNIPGCSQPG